MLDTATCGFSRARLDALFAPLLAHRTIALAVSGGPDSLALMTLFCAWAPQAPKPRAIVLTVDHGLRAQSAAQARAVVGKAHALGLEAQALAWQGDKPVTGIQAAARRARYALMGAAMRAADAAVLVTAHHRDDQAETVMMRLAHASGPHGLVGMRALTEIAGVPVHRPLLDLGKSELARVVRGHALDAVADPSNESDAFERVRWRQAMPQLAALGLTSERIERARRRIVRLDALAQAETDRFIEETVTVDWLGVYSLALSALQARHQEVVVRALCRVLSRAGSGVTPRLEAVEALAERLQGGQRDIAETLAGARIVVRGDTLIVFREHGRIAPGGTALAIAQPQRFDQRFEIVAHRAGLRLQSADAVTRAVAERFADAPLKRPMAAVHQAPAILDESGTLVALGTMSVQPGLRVCLHAPAAPRMEPS